MKKILLTDEDRSKLEEQFIDHIMDDADLEVMYALARERVQDLVEELDDEQLLADIQNKDTMGFWKP